MNEKIEQIKNRPFYQNLLFVAQGMGEGWQKQRIRRCYIDTLNQSVKVASGQPADKDVLWKTHATLKDLATRVRLQDWRKAKLAEAARFLQNSIS